jgi:hypothetical protein
MIRKFLKASICLTSFLFITNPHKIFAENPLKDGVLSLRKKAYVLYASSSHPDRRAAINLINGKKRLGWRSIKNSPFPYIFIFELAGNADIDLLKFNNKTHEDKHPGISTKQVRIEFSTVSSKSGYGNVGDFTLEKGAELQEFSIQRTKARWIRLSIESNYGHPKFTELMEFEAWGVFEFKILQIISNFMWILGLAIILASFSYHEFLAHLQKTKRQEILKRNSFRIPCLLGLILAVSGASFSVQQLWLTAILGVVAILLAVLFVKFMKLQAPKKKEGKS